MTKSTRSLLAFNAVGGLFLVLVWLRSPSQRLAAFERLDLDGLGAGERVFVAQKALDLAAREPSVEFQQRATQIAFRADPRCPALPTFSRSAFSRQTLLEIKIRLTQSFEPEPTVMLLGGFLDDKTVRFSLRQLAQSPGDRWEAHLALARLGDDHEMSYCIGKILLRQGDSGARLRRIVELDYIRRKESVRAMIDFFLNSDETIATDAQLRTHRIYAHQAAGLLSSSLEGCPPESMSANSDQFIDDTRRWVAAQHEFKIVR